ncbi:MAG: amino acid permease, partial [Micrococcus sp.]|nr:amino acid permease [Micrococcus sp.]
MKNHLAPTSAEEPGFKRSLSTLDAYAMGFGAMIGFGWVVLVGGWLENAGTGGAINAMIAGRIIICVVAMVYPELVSGIPK